MRENAREGSGKPEVNCTQPERAGTLGTGGCCVRRSARQQDVSGRGPQKFLRNPGTGALAEVSGVAGTK